MKHTASAKKKSSRFAVCVLSDGYEASLERNKIYVVLPDKDAERVGDLRVIDESGEDYLFSADRLCRSTSLQPSRRPPSKHRSPSIARPGRAMVEQ